MKQRMMIILSMGLALSFALAQGDGAPQQSASFEVAAGPGGDLSGTLFLGDYGDDLTVAVLALDGTGARDTHPAHLHTGDCASGGGVEVPLADVEGATGLSVTVLRTPFDELLAQDYHVNAHRSSQEMNVIVACGEVGEGAAQADAADAGGADAGAEQAAADAGGAEADGAAADAEQDAAAQGEQGGLRTASFQLFALQGSGISGTLNVAERVEGGSQFVVTLRGIQSGDTYLPVLFRGDCGPDRERVTALPPVGSLANDPYSSISNVEISVDEAAEGDYFLYVFEGEEEERPLACGEVGAGANR